MQASLQRRIGQVGRALHDDAKFTKSLYGIATSEKVIGRIPGQIWLLWVGSPSLPKSRAFIVVVKRGSRVVQVKPIMGIMRIQIGCQAELLKRGLQLMLVEE